MTIGGTSASGPVSVLVSSRIPINLCPKKIKQTVASIFALLNDFRLSKYNGRPLGFVNPLLYSHASAFTDIVSGSNPGCGTNGSFVLAYDFFGFC